MLKIVSLCLMSTFGVEDAIEFTQDGPEARMIASVIPYYPFHGVDRFYDISGMTQDPAAFKLCIDIFVRRYSAMGVDAIVGLDARGFVLGPPIALALGKPFIMIRKKGKLPNAVSGTEYHKEYTGANATGGDEFCISRTSIKRREPKMRVLVIDDLVATGVSALLLLLLLLLLLRLTLNNSIIGSQRAHSSRHVIYWPMLVHTWSSVPVWWS